MATVVSMGMGIDIILPLDESVKYDRLAVVVPSKLTALFSFASLSKGLGRSPQYSQDTVVAVTAGKFVGSTSLSGIYLPSYLKKRSFMIE